MPDTPIQTTNTQPPQPAEQPLIYDIMPDYKVVVPKVASSGGQNLSQLHLPNKNAKARLLWMVVFVLSAAVVAVLGFVGYKVLTSESAQVESAQTSKQSELSVSEADTSQEVGLGIGITSEFLLKYFDVDQCADKSLCGSEADPDKDGLKNFGEQKNSTDPNNADSDGDGLADGDEVNIFGSNPANARTAGLEKYTDAQEVLAGYSPVDKNRKYTEEEKIQISKKVKEFGIHTPTIATLGVEAAKMYHFDTDEDVSSLGTKTSIITPVEEVKTSEAESFGPLLPLADQSPEEMLGRDTQRMNTIKKIGVAVLRYKNESGKFPDAANFDELYTVIKPFLGVATNAQDPINKEQYVYTYKLTSSADFLLTYFSETQKQIIKYTLKNAQKDYDSQQKAALDEDRMRDIESIKSALMLYSRSHLTAQSKVDNVFPAVAELRSELVPKYLNSLPKDPKTGKDYEYKVSRDFDSFTLKVQLDNPPDGTTGYLCNQDDECDYY
ncbi:MAG TPA: hypothetical protein VEA59_04945 [Patescibacteria group bacterium]|nr:hypothetical protein [Patescibacteria group bacterium]